MNRIDNTSLDEMQVYLHKGSDNEIWAFPARIEPDHNDWYEERLRDADLLLPPSYEKKKLTIEFVILKPTEERLAKVRSLLDHRSITLYVGQFEQAYQLRPLKFVGYRHLGGLVQKAPGAGILSVEFEQEDIPAIYTAEKSSPQPSSYTTYVVLDGADLSQFGVVVNQAYSSALLPQQFKRPDDTLPSNSIAIECTMLADSANSLKGNLAALFQALNQKGSRDLVVAGIKHKVYYTSMKETSKGAPFTRGHKHIIRFTLNFQTVK